jgi:phytoene synthase
VTTELPVQRAYDTCARVTLGQARNFAYGMRLLPGEKRRAMYAVYALSRRVDDIGDGHLPAAEKLRQLDTLRGQVHRLGESDDPVLVALADARRRFPIPVDAFHELIDGVEMDVRNTSYDSFADLVTYCRRVAGSIGRLCLGVFGSTHPDAARRADVLGIALQQVNILRDIREDLGNGRVYLPGAELRAHGCDLRLTPAGDIAPPHAPLVALVRESAARAARWFDEGLTLLPLLNRRSAACCGAMAGIYRQLLDRIAGEPEHVVRGRMSLSGWQKAAVAARSLARSGR